MCYDFIAHVAGVSALPPLSRAVVEMSVTLGRARHQWGLWRCYWIPVLHWLCCKSTSECMLGVTCFRLISIPLGHDMTAQCAQAFSHVDVLDILPLDEALFVAGRHTRRSITAGPARSSHCRRAARSAPQPSRSAPTRARAAATPRPRNPRPIERLHACEHVFETPDGDTVRVYAAHRSAARNSTAARPAARGTYEYGNALSKTGHQYGNALAQNMWAPIPECHSKTTGRARKQWGGKTINYHIWPRKVQNHRAPTRETRMLKRASARAHCWCFASA